MTRALDMQVVIPGSAGLSGEGAGAYFRLCWVLWCQGGAVSDAPTILAKLAGVAQAQWARVWEEIGDRFEVSGGAVSHAAVSEAWQAEQARLERANRSSAAGVAARIAKRKASQIAHAQIVQNQQVVNGSATHGTTQPVNKLSTNSQPLVDDLLTGCSLTCAPAVSDRSDPDRSLRSLALSVSESSLPIGSDSGSGSDAREDRVNGAPLVRAVFAHYRTLHPKAFPRPTAGGKEWVKIAARLREGYTLEDLCQAIDGYHASPFHCGDNDRQTTYLDLGLIMRTGGHVAKGIELANAPQAMTMSPRERRSAVAIKNIMTRQRKPMPEDSPWNVSQTLRASASR